MIRSFILLDLLLSYLAALQAPAIMMSQNRQATKDRLEARHDYEANSKAGMEIIALHAKVGRPAGPNRLEAATSAIFGLD